MQTINISVIEDQFFNIVRYKDYMTSMGLSTNRELLNMQTVTRKLKHMIYFNGDHQNTPECSKRLSESFDCTWDLAETWEEVTRCLSNGERTIITHVSMIENSNSSVAEFVKAIESIITFMPLTAPLLIGVVITRDTDISIINQLRKTSVTGLLLDITEYEFNEVKLALDHFLHRKPYWPNHIISELPNNANKIRPISVSFKKNWKSEISPDDYIKLKSPTLPWTQEFCCDWTDLGEILKKEPYQIIVNIESITQNGTSIDDFVIMLDTFIKGVIPNKSVPIAVSINKNTTLTTIKELQKSNVFGIVPAIIDFGVEETLKGIDALHNRIPYWPKHILDQLPNEKKPKSMMISGIALTPRQQQIFKLVATRGASNKVIAKTLKITESTVKAHVSAILKAYGVRNRTQLVVSANSNP